MKQLFTDLEKKGYVGGNTPNTFQAYSKEKGMTEWVVLFAKETKEEPNSITLTGMRIQVSYKSNPTEAQNLAVSYILNYFKSKGLM